MCKWRAGNVQATKEILLKSDCKFSLLDRSRGSHRVWQTLQQRCTANSVLQSGSACCEQDELQRLRRYFMATRSLACWPVHPQAGGSEARRTCT